MDFGIKQIGVKTAIRTHDRSFGIANLEEKEYIYVQHKRILALDGVTCLFNSNDVITYDCWPMSRDFVNLVN